MKSTKFAINSTVKSERQAGKSKIQTKPDPHLLLLLLSLRTNRQFHTVHS